MGTIIHPKIRNIKRTTKQNKKTPILGKVVPSSWQERYPVVYGGSIGWMDGDDGGGPYTASNSVANFG